MRDYGLEPIVWDGKEDCEHEWGNEITRKTSDNYNANFNERWGNASGLRKQEKSSYGELKIGQFCIHCNAWSGSLGLEPTFKLYLQHLQQIFKEVKRVLKKTGTVFVNVGDSYGGWQGKHHGWNDNKQTVGERGVAQHDKSHTQAKSLCQIPERFSLMMTDELGFIKRNTIIWWKRNCMPSSARDRFTVDFEPVYFYTKQGKYWFKQQLEQFNRTEESKKRVKYGRYAGRSDTKSKHRKGKPDFLNIPGNDWGDKKGGRNKRTVWEHNNDQLLRDILRSDESIEEKLAWIKIELSMETERSIWDIPTQSSNEPHFAIFPEALVETPILAGCPENGIVLDPFMGTGTTGNKALKLNRNFIGFELNPDDVERANKRIALERQQLKMEL